ncbi:hypothetical protein J4N42_08605 [Vibrio sp. SCSIO 43135]|uniref:tetratricopeptide repeat protein n=1 Tax=Vibrio sp. SCSIO 43135 TaxID=2819096 RepID=UPI002075344D|nr:CDC27 family protein [Vibrio sp. SCSIO 43135]USD40135.1 hypothetical protein J4N42_08605 [Vibrio sp. SCSIO 43135]
MLKHIFTVLVSLVVVTGCVSNETTLNDDNKEMIYQQTNNHAELVSLYKQRVAAQDTLENRINLASAYYQSGRYDSALFVLEPLGQQQGNYEVLLVKAKSQFKLGRTQQSIDTAISALELQSTGEINNQLGVAYSQLGELDVAREYFVAAKRRFYDDVKVDNNLAVLDILEGDYASAVARLQPLYTQGVADDTMQANLVLALVKSGELAQAKRLIAAKGSRKQAALYVEQLAQLQSLDPAAAE